MEGYIQVGKIINTHGIKGELKILPLTDEITRFEELPYVIIENENEELEIESVKYKKNFVILKLKAFNNINEVIEFKNRYLLIHEKDSKELPENTYFIFELIGLEVFTTTGENIGKVIDVLQPGANDVYVVKNNGKEYLIPAIKDIIKEINIEDKKMIIDPIEGLIE
jgi:16S rRNA processing protein RimM